MDGTLVDSERLWGIAMNDLARELGGAISVAALDGLVGADLDTTVTVLHAEVGLPDTPDRAARTRDLLVDRVAALLAAGVDPLPGAREALRAVRDAGVPAALVTSTGRRLTEVTLDSIGREFFDVVVCGDEVAATKPDPEPYLRAAELLGVAATDCVAVEDSPSGALAAERAGAGVLVVAGEVPVPDGPRRTRRADLVGLTVAELAAVVRGPSRAA